MKRQLYITASILAVTGLMSGCAEGVKGCTDPNSINYNPNAEVSDGTCTYPSQTKKVVCFYFNDTDNNTCGSFGINLLDQVKSTTPPNTFFITAHPNGTDSLFSPVSIDVASTFNVTGVPDFGVGEMAGLITQSAILNAIDAEASETAMGAVSVDYTTTADSIIATIYGKFFEGDTASYFAAAYVVESNVVMHQTGLSPAYSHQHVLRASSGPSGIGDQVNPFPFGPNTSFKIRRGIPRDPVWNTGNIQVIAVLWKQNGTDIEYINAGD